MTNVLFCQGVFCADWICNCSQVISRDIRGKMLSPKMIWNAFWPGCCERMNGNLYDNGFTDTVQGMPLRAAIRCIRFLSASRPNSLRSDSGLGGGSLPAPHYAVLLSIPRLVSVILLSVNVMRENYYCRHDIPYIPWFVFVICSM